MDMRHPTTLPLVREGVLRTREGDPTTLCCLADGYLESAGDLTRGRRRNRGSPTRGAGALLARVTAKDRRVAHGAEGERAVLPQVDDIMTRARRLVEE